MRQNQRRRPNAPPPGLSLPNKPNPDEIEAGGNPDKQADRQCEAEVKEMVNEGANSTPDN